MFCGKVYTISCRQLREQGYQIVADTKEGSYLQANLWWQRKEAQARAEQAPPRLPLPMEDVMRAAGADFYDDARKAQNHLPWDELEEWLDTLRCQISPLLPGPDGKPRLGWVPPPAGVPLTAAEQQRLIMEAHERQVLRFAYQYMILGRPLPEGMVKALQPAQVAALETVVRGEPASAPDRTVGAYAEMWLERLRAKVAAGGMSANRCDINRRCLLHFTHHVGANADVTGVNEAAVEGFYLFCQGQVALRLKDKSQGFSLAYAKDVFATARSFVRWLWESGTIELPRNLESRGFDFGAAGQKVRTWTPTEFQRVIGSAQPRLRPALLLMANCGMTQKDVSDLLDEEVDWVAGTVTRKRSKTRHEPNVPTVTYRLWPTTFVLLQKHRSGQDRVLLTVEGKPYVRSEIRDGKLVKTDGIYEQWKHTQRRLGVGHLRLKQLRKLGASLLASHKDYGRLVPYFLGHSPRTVADRHYVVPPQELLDEAVTWLGQQLGQVS
jgi:integrase